MKIGIDAKDLEGRRTGVGRYLINLLSQWNKSGLPEGAELILYFRKEIPKDLNLDNPAFKKKVLPFGGFSNALFMHILLAFAAYKDKVDILFCPGYISPVIYFGRTALALHDIVYEARPDLYNWPSFLDKILLRQFSRISAKRAEKIFSCSEFSRKEIIKHYKVSPEKVFVNYLGVDELIKRVDNTGGIKEELKIKDKFVLYLGSISNRRHLPEAMLAFEKKAEKLPGCQFLVIGENITSPFVDIDGLAEQINKRLGREAVLRMDYLPDKSLAELYSAADLFLWISDYEGFGLPVLEAMACEVPVITSYKASIPEVAGDAALYIQNNSDTAEIQKAIYRGLTDIELRNNLINKGLEQVKKFSWGKCAGKTLDALMNY